MDTKKGRMNKIINIAAIPVLGINKYGEVIKEHDKLLCGNGLDTWFTHVMFDKETGCWHRERDYYYGKIVGSYTM